MAVILETPDHSFVEIGEGEIDTGCVPHIPLCLPVLALSDLRYQVIATVPKVDESWFEVEYEDGGETYKDTIYARLCQDCSNAVGIDLHWRGVWTQTEEGGSGEDTWMGDFQFNGNATTFNGLDAGTCFNICFHRVKVKVSDGTIWLVHAIPIACTETCFNKITDPCFTSAFTYRCNENAFDFIYVDENGDPLFSNKVRISCYLRGMQLPSEELSYIKSNGGKKKLFERIEEEYDLHVDWLPKAWHKKLKVLLAHDSIGITNVNDAPDTGLAIICREKYEIQWPDIPWETAPAKTKVVRSAALALTNTNCR